MLSKTLARSLDEPARIMGVTPLEWATLGVSYAVLSVLLKGVPASALLSLAAAVVGGAATLILNRNFPPHHGVLLGFSWIRPRITPVMSSENYGRQQ